MPILLAGILAAGAVLLGGRPALAEPFLDLYGGAAQTESARVTAGQRDCDVGFFFAVCGPETEATRNADFDLSATFGVRGGYWIDPVPWLGVAGDLSTFEADAADVRFRIVPFSVLVMFRLPLLATDEIPRGRLQPYVGVGPSIAYYDTTVDFRPELARKLRFDSVELGLDVRAGLAWQFHPRVGVFTEYRFTYLPIDTDEDSDFGPIEERVDTKLNTHHILMGVSIRF
ncbi:MAG TPA: outer membrane beta-barrel protein [Methylomirabilota bacterium]|nr:outer membrane beta-barrel protein [Methylomirabilota bacterium]